MACGIKLAVYVKGRNAKKYRKNIEYGSARWGRPEDIKPFIDPTFRQQRHPHGDGAPDHE